jgi:hypothetical protein
MILSFGIRIRSYALVIGFPEGSTPGLTTGIVQGGDTILMNFPGGGGT